MGFFHNMDGGNRNSPAPPRPSNAERRRLHLERLERRANARRRLEDELEGADADFDEADDEARPRRHTCAPAPVIERRRLGQARLAEQRLQKPGVQRLTRALHEIEYRQRELQAAADGLRAVLGIRSLAKAYAAFQDEGGVTAADWQDWLEGRRLRGRNQHRSKLHLRLIVNKDKSAPI
jgi:hypothetical protein